MEKGEIAHFKQFHLFPQCFPKDFFFIELKQVYMEERVKCLATKDAWKVVFVQEWVSLHGICQTEKKQGAKLDLIIKHLTLQMQG